jgi:hypothetical protein
MNENCENIIHYDNIEITQDNEHVIKNDKYGQDKEQEEEDVNILSGDNKVDVDIEPDVKADGLILQICSCSFIFNCFTNNSREKN